MKLPQRLLLVAFFAWAFACHMSETCRHGDEASCPAGTFCYAGANAKAGEVGICAHNQVDVLPLEAGLRIELIPSTLHFSPIGERSLALEVVVSGLRAQADASGIELDIGHLDKPAWLLLGGAEREVSEDSIRFKLNVQYGGTTFTESPGAIHLRLLHIPTDYAYANEARSVHVVLETGDEAHPIRVSRANIEAFNTYANTDAGLKLHYRLEEDVVLPSPSSGPSNWKPIGRYVSDADDKPFTGRFDGGGHSIAGLVIHAPGDNCQGLFGLIGAGAVVKNIGLEGGSVTGTRYVGSLVGLSFGTVQNSYATGDVKGDGLYVGGLVGSNNRNGTVQNSYATGNTSGNSRVGGLAGASVGGTVENSYATGAVSGNDYVGGLLGLNYEGSTVQSSYATGAVSGWRWVGGLVGENRNDKVQNSVALNPRVFATDVETGRVGRVVGVNSVEASPLHNNHARSNMTVLYGVNSSGGGGMPLNLVGTTTNKHGQNVSSGTGAVQYNNPAFWQGLGWDFDNAWQWNPTTRLPILRDVGGEQNHKVP